MQRTAVIVGSDGQDGQLLSAHLLRLGYSLASVTRGAPDITDAAQVLDLLEDVKPAEIYFLAAHHHSSEALPADGADLQRLSFETNTIAPGNFLSAIVRLQLDTRFFYASSALVFPGDVEGSLDESSPMAPNSVYGITKVAAMQLCRRYRDHLGVKASCGILFNHESIYRPEGYLSKKIARAASRLAKTGGAPLTLANLDAVVDWGAAEDVVAAMHLIVQREEADDYVVATGIPHTVRDFVDIAFQHAGIDYRQHVRLDERLLGRPPERRIGSPRKLKRDTDWAVTIPFETMVKRLVDHELSLA